MSLPLTIDAVVTLPLPSTTPTKLYSLSDVARSLSVSSRSLQRERLAGRFPSPDIQLRPLEFWAVGTIDAWIMEGGCWG
jgi:hypothetical protein